MFSVRRLTVLLFSSLSPLEENTAAEEIICENEFVVSFECDAVKTLCTK